MHYAILVNGVRVGVYGHPHVRNMSLALQVMDGHIEVFASGVCAEPDGFYMFNWLQHSVSASDVVVLEPTTEASSAVPITRYKLRDQSEP